MINVMPRMGLMGCDGWGSPSVVTTCKFLVYFVVLDWLDGKEQSWPHVYLSKAEPLQPFRTQQDEWSEAFRPVVHRAILQHCCGSSLAGSNTPAVMSSTCAFTTIGIGRSCDGWRTNQRGCGCGPWTWWPMKNLVHEPYRKKLNYYWTAVPEPPEPATDS